MHIRRADLPFGSINWPLLGTAICRNRCGQLRPSEIVCGRMDLNCEGRTYDDFVELLHYNYNHVKEFGFQRQKVVRKNRKMI